MALSDEKSVLLISNCKSVTEEENTLTSFSGSIPLKYLDENKTWFVALHSCGLHLNVKQTLCPKSKHHPSLMHITWKDYSASVLEHSVDDVSKLPLGMFEDRHKLFIDREKSYSPESLVKEIEVVGTILPEYSPIIGVGPVEAAFKSPSYKVKESYLKFR